MSIKNFIESVRKSLSIDDYEKSGKKKSVKNLLKKLRERENKILKSLKKKLDKKDKKELNEELEIIELQIKNGKKILEKLNS
ncbi:hypothetical protein SMGD1_1617 [Sulfurimonas gotlandica GD1]|jgi:FixJ family two-component response regulator|uniref:Uncharacterized protein n=1 Tax=Sulfurimonas gotlandica (strain DSM 19862 / JCM 16533 / GD1) TaxID=929558 RepID=B6BHY9_SULGG|nr:hypothetical protein [Sulfurimonas gotlandica]EDZ63331.1 hypothetical protein CBGD1_951 [Sulfurimonas gotlandica GD1]EHP30141.1 hypothetical protein SMGD1_1617 [Sulfurimonas gotlandica GD1]